MPASTPQLEDLSEPFPVFPLAGALLLPGGRLPLNIFEPRYLALTEDALARARLFAMIQPDASRPAGPNGPALYRVGCLGRITSFSETDDGRYLVTLTGLIRFVAAEELPMQRGYRRLRGDFTAFRPDLRPRARSADFDRPDIDRPDIDRPDIDRPDIDRTAMAEALRGYFAHHDLNANWDAIAKMPDDELVTTLAMVCPFAPPEKQALLEAADAAARAATLLTLLRIDSHGASADDGGSPGRAS